MPTLVIDNDLEQQLQAERRASGADRYDEVWEGTYVMSPMPNDEHQQLVMRLAAIFQMVIDWPALGHVRPGVNVSDRIDDWTSNYRVPDVAVFLNEGRAENHDAFWYGGPDFVVEIISPDDRSREKLRFYQSIGVRELLLVDRFPWQLELHQLREGELSLQGKSTIGDGSVLCSEVLPFSFQLVPNDDRPQIAVAHTQDDQRWLV